MKHHLFTGLSLYVKTEKLYNDIAMKTGRITTIICLLIVTVFTVTGCTTFNNFRESFLEDQDSADDAINIGVYEPITGSYKDDAAPEIIGIELAHETHPQIGGHDVNLIYGDNSSDIDAAETAVNTLIAKNPSVILGSYGNIFSLMAGQYNQEARIPAIAITNTNPLITLYNDYYFRVCYIDATQGKMLAQYLHSIKEKEAGILIPEKDDAATAMSTAFADELKALTDNDDAISCYQTYTTGDTDFSKQLKAIRKSGVQSVLLPGEIIDAENIIRQAHAMELNIRFLGSTKWGNPDFMEAIQRDENGELTRPIEPEHFAFVQFFATNGKDDTAVISKARKEFLDAYHSKYGNSQEPTEAVALGYDAYLIAADAVASAYESTGEVDNGEAIRDVLMEPGYEFDGASGVIRFNKLGDPKKTAYISTWDNHSIKAIYTIEAADQ